VEAVLALAIDGALPDDTVRIARGVPETAGLTDAPMTFEAVAETVAA
jgi:hypothetical protein